MEPIPEESRSVPLKDVTEDFLKQRLSQLKESAQKEITAELENEFCQLVQLAIKFYDDEMKYELAQFYFEYGSVLLTKLENTTDIFGGLLKKKAEQEENQKQSSENQQQQKQQEQKPVEQQQQNKMEDEKPVPEQVQEQKQEEVVASENTNKNVVYKNNDVTIEDETEKKEEKPQQQQQVNKMLEEEVVEEKKEQKKNDDEENADDMQILYENLYTAYRISEKDYEKIKRTNTDEDIKNSYDLKQRVLFLAEVCRRLGEFENWREKCDEALGLFTESRKYLAIVESEEESRIIAELEFMLGTTQLYKEKADEIAGIQNFINSIQILENVLSKLCSLPKKTFSNSQEIKKENIEIEHLKEGFMDTTEIREIKQILKSLYEKLEDTILQRDQKPQYEAEQQKMKEQQNVPVFKPVDTTKVQVKNLGVLGNAKKRKPQANNVPDFMKKDQNSDQNDKQKPQEAAAQNNNNKSTEEQNQDKKEN